MATVKTQKSKTDSSADQRSSIVSDTVSDDLWRYLTAEQFFAGYHDGDAIYDDGTVPSSAPSRDPGTMREWRRSGSA
jgi:hypothetical protein